ncbi:MAG: hypothetical protein A2173_04310 [Planctomycetes bacterium RBG_13_44_8b]|nr:MAG: hypothetical protein A2173_04310 [Planctomycetes bacterium RBG_13_44_8b]
MKLADNIHKMIKKMHVKASAELDKKVHDDISISLAESACAKTSTMRSITKVGIVKLAVAAAIFIAFGVGFSIGRWSQPPQPEPPSLVIAYVPSISIHSSASKSEDGFWRQKVFAAMQPKPYAQTQFDKTSLLNAYKQYLKEKYYD